VRQRGREGGLSKSRVQLIARSGSVFGVRRTRFRTSLGGQIRRFSRGFSYKPHRPNFGFLAEQDEQLVHFAALAERYFADDPNTCLIKLRQFAELLAQSVAARTGRYETAQESLSNLVRRPSLGMGSATPHMRAGGLLAARISTRVSPHQSV
jgi:hypothetical protein